ncbi:hypothetical protein TI39_contig4188g00008 [Zymoseptoria brevis]|uniref:Uncharacterized protein n=1 Tax=Zymoseptoria brevis TaxID=1047168 RepID=A0A0F4GBX3_9PEZI|nr:hypothetical protein TI39_contig4188g00008 [Zymoseptoria brevis]
MRFLSVLTAVLLATFPVDAAILPDLDSRSPSIHDATFQKRRTQRCAAAGTDRTNCRAFQTIASCNAARASTLCKQNTRCKSYAVTTASNGVQSCGLYAFPVSQVYQANSQSTKRYYDVNCDVAGQDEHDDFETGYYNDEMDKHYNPTGKHHKPADKHYCRANEYHSEPHKHHYRSYKQHNCKIKHYYGETEHHAEIKHLLCHTESDNDKSKHSHSKTELDHDEIKLDEHRDKLSYYSTGLHFHN